MEKKKLSETEIRTGFITPAIRNAGWDLITQLREEVPYTKGRIFVRGTMTTRGKMKVLDYLLSYQPNQPLAVVEAKDNRPPLARGCNKPSLMPPIWTSSLCLAATATAFSFMTRP